MAKGLLHELRRLGIAILPPLRLPSFDRVRLVRGGVELDQAVEGFGDAQLSTTRIRDLLLPSLRPHVALQQERLGPCVLILAQERPADLRLGVEGPPFVGLFLLADGQALAKDRLGVGPLFLSEYVAPQRRQFAGVFLTLPNAFSVWTLTWLVANVEVVIIPSSERGTRVINQRNTSA
jgi:hypothetical protein